MKLNTEKALQTEDSASSIVASTCINIYMLTMTQPQPVLLEDVLAGHQKLASRPEPNVSNQRTSRTLLAGLLDEHKLVQALAKKPFATRV